MTLAGAIFTAFVASTLIITWWARGRARNAAEFYTAASSVRPWQNGLAIAGDYLSAASFLGTTAVFFTFGIDGLYYAIGAIAGWPVATCLIAERLRHLGRYTFSDALGAQLGDGRIRVMTCVITVCICGAYLTSQMVGAGVLVEALFNIPYSHAVILVGTLMSAYVMFGGMVATTWIQVTKASLLLATVALMTFLVLRNFSFSFDRLIDAAALMRARPDDLLRPGGLIPGPMDAVGLALAFSLGPAGMPHVLMRFFTVPDAASARRSLVFATSLIALFQLMVIVLGLGAIALTGPDAIHHKPGESANLAVVYLAQHLGGPTLFGMVAAVTFATIVAVVSGLTLAAAAAVSHDLYRYVVRKDRVSDAQELRVSRLTTAAIGLVSIALGLTFRNQNVGFLATLPLVIAASSNFPILMLTLHWKRLTPEGALAGGYVGLVASIALVLLGPKVWTGVFGHSSSILGFDYGTPISLAAALASAYVFSVHGIRRGRASDPG